MHSENLEAPWRFKYQVGHLHCSDSMADILNGLLMWSSCLIEEIAMWLIEDMCVSKDISEIGTRLK